METNYFAMERFLLCICNFTQSQNFNVIFSLHYYVGVKDKVLN